MNLDENRLVRTIYDYESNDEKLLNFKANELFIILKNGDDFTYVVNAYGRLGYIPTNFCEPTTLNDNEYLQFVKNVLSLLESSLTKNTNITKRQINHAQVKLTQLRCELVKKLSKLNPITPDEHKKTFVLENTNLADTSLDNDNKLNEKEIKKVKKEVKTKKSSSKRQAPLPIEQTTIPDNLTLDLLDKIRFTTNCNYNVCKLTLKSVLNCLKLNLPQMHDDLNLILRQINTCDQNISLEFIKKSIDYLELKSLFNKLWYCKNDEQQRSWPIQEDEEQIKYILNSLASILKNANPKISKEILCDNKYENINLLITYFQMENRGALKLEIYSVFLQIIRLMPDIIPEIMLPSVLPGALCNELINYKMDKNRWSLATKLFTAIFSTGDRPPISVYDYINEQFINSLLDLVEEGSSIVEISPENSIPPILSFNLHFDQDDYNYVINSLRNRNSANHLLENLSLMLNWSEDPTLISSILSDELNNKDNNNNNNFNLELEQSEQLEQLEQNESIDNQIINKSHNNKRINSVHKLLLEMFDDEIIAKFFYYNDICVLIDILVTFLNNSHSDDKNRITYLKLFLRICQNTNYKDEPQTHKLKEILKCLKLVLNDEQSNEEEKRLAEIIIELFV